MRKIVGGWGNDPGMEDRPLKVIDLTLEERVIANVEAQLRRDAGDRQDNPCGYPEDRVRDDAQAYILSMSNVDFLREISRALEEQSNGG